MAWHCYEANHQEAYASPSLASESMKRSMNSQNLSDIAAMRMTYLMYYVAWIYVLDSVPWLDTCACGDIGRHRYSTLRDIKLILLISRDAIHMVVCRYTHRSVVLLQADDWNQLGLRGEHRCSKDDSPRYLPSGYKYATSLCTSFGNNVFFIWERGT